MVNPWRSHAMLKCNGCGNSLRGGCCGRLLTFHVKNPSEQTDHEQTTHGAHENSELISCAPGLPVDGDRSAETVHDREVSAASHRGGVYLLGCRHRGRMYSGEIRQIRGRE